MNFKFESFCHSRSTANAFGSYKNSMISFAQVSPGHRTHTYVNVQYKDICNYRYICSYYQIQYLLTYCIAGNFRKPKFSENSFQ